MRTEVRRQIEALNRRRRALLDELETLPREKLAYKSASNRWSLLQIVEHLVLAEREVLGHPSNGHKRAAVKRGLRARLAYLLVLLVLRLGLPVPPASPAMVPGERASMAELRWRWDENYRWLSAFVDEVKPDRLVHAVFRHPIAGPLTLPQVVHIGQLHFDYHRRQIERRKRQLIMPQSMQVGSS
jgi:hypothetical protein